MESDYSKKRYKAFSRTITSAVLTVLLHVVRLIEWIPVWLVLLEVACALATLFFAIKYWRYIGSKR